MKFAQRLPTRMKIPTSPSCAIICRLGTSRLGMGGQSGSSPKHFAKTAKSASALMGLSLKCNDNAGRFGDWTAKGKSCQAKASRNQAHQRSKQPGTSTLTLMSDPQIDDGRQYVDYHTRTNASIVRRCPGFSGPGGPSKETKVININRLQTVAKHEHKWKTPTISRNTKTRRSILRAPLDWLHALHVVNRCKE